MADLTLNDDNYSKVVEDTLAEIKKTVADALVVFETSRDINAIQSIVPIEPSERSESTFESSQVGSLCFGEDLGIEDANEIARNISSENSLDIRWAAFKVNLFHILTIEIIQFFLHGFIIRRFMAYN